MSVTPIAATSTDEITARVNAEIRVGLARADMTNRDLAARVGMTYQSFWRRMAGEVSWNLVELVAVARHLGLDDVRDLFR